MFNHIKDENQSDFLDNIILSDASEIRVYVIVFLFGMLLGAFFEKREKYKEILIMLHYFLLIPQTLFLVYFSSRACMII